MLCSPMRARTGKEWEDFIAEIGSEGVICHTSAEWLEHPQALGSKIIEQFGDGAQGGGAATSRRPDLADPELGPFRGPGINTRMASAAASVGARTRRAKESAL